MAKLVECLPSTGELWGLLSQEDQESISILNYIDCVRPSGYMRSVKEKEMEGGREKGWEGERDRRRVRRTEGEKEERS